MKTTELKALKDRIIFDNLYYCDIEKKNIVSFIIDKVNYNYCIKLDHEVYTMYYGDTCKYQGFINCGMEDRYEFNVSLKELSFFETWDKEPFIELSQEDIKEIEAFLNEYFDEFPEIVTEVL